MSDDEKSEAKPDHEPPAGAETTATWTGGDAPIDYTASAKWLVLRKKEKPAAEIFSVSYVAGGGDEDRPVTFVFNGGPGASSAFLHMGAVGPQRVDFPADGSLPEMPPRLVQNEASWLAFSDLVFVDPIGTGFSRVIEDEKPDDAKDKKDDSRDPKEYFGYKRDLESLCEFMGRWLSDHGRWGSAVFIAGESYGGYRVGRLVRMLQESAGIGLNGAILISPALEIALLSPTDYDVLGWVDTSRRWPPRLYITDARVSLQTEPRSTRCWPRRRSSRPATTRRSLRGVPRCPRTSAIASSRGLPIFSGFLSISSSAPRAESRFAPSLESFCATSAKCLASTTPRSRSPTRSPTSTRSWGLIPLCLARTRRTPWP
jgi:hypothetical protein